MLTNFLVFLIASSLFFSRRGEFEIPEGLGGRLGGGYIFQEINPILHENHYILLLEGAILEGWKVFRCD